MADSDPYARRSLRDWLFDSFRTSTQTNPPTPQARLADEDATTTEYPSEVPDARTRLLESYYRPNPVCGEQTCNHGTFSPRPEDQEIRQPWGESSIPAASAGILSGESSRIRLTSAPESENIPSMESSASALAVKNRRTLYVRVQETARGHWELINMIPGTSHTMFHS